jgi:putative DNA primase/helicase
MTQPEWVRIDPIPDDAPELPKQRNVKSDDGTWQHYTYTHVWPYRDVSGLRGFVTRYETPTGKETPALTLWRGPDGALKWRHKGLPDPRPLYNGQLLAENPQATVVITEGEKCAEMLQGLLDAAGLRQKMLSATWAGGSKAVRKTDWTPLRARNVVLWSDADAPGAAAMSAVAAILSGQGCAVRMIAPEPDRPPGWDVADWILAGGKLPEIAVWMRSRSEPWVPHPAEHHADPAASEGAAPPPAEGEADAPADVGAAPFRFLGYGAGHCYYLPAGTRQVCALPAVAHSAGALLAIAPLTYWERTFSGAKGVNWKMAANTIMRGSELHGVFDPLRQRGRGAWYDDGRTVLHLGNRLLVDGQETRIDKFDTRYIYEAGPEIHYSGADQLDNREASKVREILDSLFWEVPKNGLLMAGWLTIAPICGALHHRPHCWLTGAASWGKSFVVEQIATPLLGEFALQLLSSTTSAGVRQTLGCDALPVVIDEFEGEDYTSMDRIQGMMELSRQSFSDSGARIIKGSQSGKAVSYQIRSCFLMSSITVNMCQKADETRVAVVSLKQPQDSATLSKEAHFAGLKKRVYETLTPDWCARFRARAIGLVPVIRDNALTFAAALAEVIGSRRAGDQLGALAAGAYSLSSNRRVTEEQALEWARRQDWSSQRVAATDTDEARCLAHILSHEIVVDRSTRCAVAEALQVVRDWQSDALGTKPEESNEYRALSRTGLRLDPEEGVTWISASYPPLTRLMQGTPWQRSYGLLLSRLPGAVPRAALRYCGAATRAVGVPNNLIF